VTAGKNWYNCRQERREKRERGRQRKRDVDNLGSLSADRRTSLHWTVTGADRMTEDNVIRRSIIADDLKKIVDQAASVVTTSAVTAGAEHGTG